MIVRNYAHYMLIFQLHLPRVIPNSMQALRALSHSEISWLCLAAMHGQILQIYHREFQLREFNILISAVKLFMA